MSTTVSRLLEIPLFKENTHLVTDCGLNNEVQYVTVMEAPDFHFDGLNDRVLILTTLSAHHGSIEEINRVIQGLCEAKVSAIGIKLGRFIDAVDPSTAEIARSYDVPIIALNHSVLFREALSEALSVIVDNQRLIINQMNDMNSKLFRAILQNCSIGELITLLCDKVPCYCCCFDSTGNKIAEATSLEDELDVAAVRSAICSFYEGRERDDSDPYVQCENTIIFPCRAQRRLLGIFCIALQDGQTELVLPLAELIVNALGVKFLEQNLKLQAEREMVASILDDILFTHRTDEATAIDRLSLLNFTPVETHMLAILSYRGSDYVQADEFHSFSIIQNVFSSRFEASVVFKRGNEYVVLLSLKRDRAADSTPKAISYCGTVIADALHKRIDTGCSGYVEDFCKMPDCYQQAKKALRFGRMFDKDGHIFMYDDYFEMGLISCGLNSGDCESFFSRIIRPVRNYDEQYKSELWSTLEHCFLHDTLEGAAAALFIHISTLRYRLQKIQGMTSYNYFDTKGKMTLYLAYLLYTVSVNRDPT